jgi:microcystin-dependent protein
VEGALTEVVTSLNTLLSNLGTISNLWKRDGTNAASANIPMGGFKFTGLVDGSASTDSATVGQVSALNSTISNLGNTFVRKDGTTTMTGIFNAGNFRVSNVAAPTTGTDATNKTYVDAQLGSAAPAGTIVAFGAAVAPTGWVLCNGQTQVRQVLGVNTPLFTAIGTTYGAGDGTTTFNVPNLQGRFPIGAGNGAQKNVSGSGIITGGNALAARTVGQFGGEEDHVLTVAELATHSHEYRWGTAPGAGPGPDGEAAIGDNLYGAQTGTQGLNTAHNTTPSFVVVSYIIKT